MTFVRRISINTGSIIRRIESIPARLSRGHKHRTLERDTDRVSKTLPHHPKISDILTELSDHLPTSPMPQPERSLGSVGEEQTRGASRSEGISNVMSIQSARELESTRKNLKMLESRIRELDSEPISNPHTRELTKRSLKKLVNQLKEESRVSRRASARVSSA